MVPTPTLRVYIVLKPLKTTNKFNDPASVSFTPNIKFIPPVFFPTVLHESFVSPFIIKCHKIIIISVYNIL